MKRLLYFNFYMALYCVLLIISIGGFIKSPDYFEIWCYATCLVWLIQFAVVSILEYKGKFRASNIVLLIFSALFTLINVLLMTNELAALLSFFVVIVAIDFLFRYYNSRGTLVADFFCVFLSRFGFFTIRNLFLTGLAAVAATVLAAYILRADILEFVLSVLPFIECAICFFGLLKYPLNKAEFIEAKNASENA